MTTLDSLLIDIKEEVKPGKTVTFAWYSKGNLWYRTASGKTFPVPVADTGDGQFNDVDKAILFMRYMRKHNENIREDNEACSDL